ncbi:MAG TPA: endonuclease/exonuclease/phosphatase family protein [Vicinamibacteria bacterium]|nr:endonuclease/exonuclease/phosphatase family protein [Vicinamibacteria bacterium]
MRPKVPSSPVFAAAAALAAAVVAAGSSCAPVLNYVERDRPRYEGRFAAPDADPAVRVVTFNVKFAREIDRAARLLREHEELRGADIVALQEMDGEGTERIARALAMDYVYYPAVRHPAHDRDFGNALLSRWPLSDDRKLVLPHRNRFRDMQRIAVSATAATPLGPVRVYSVHLETLGGIAAVNRQRQAAAVIRDARAYARVIVAGDFNSRAVGEVFEWYGFRWVTRDLGSTVSVFAWDHVFVRGLEVARGSAGIVRDNQGASDHLPVWAVLDVFPSGGQVVNDGQPAARR